MFLALRNPQKMKSVPHKPLKTLSTNTNKGEISTSIKALRWLIYDSNARKKLVFSVNVCELYGLALGGEKSEKI